MSSLLRGTCRDLFASYRGYVRRESKIHNSRNEIVRKCNQDPLEPSMRNESPLKGPRPTRLCVKSKRRPLKRGSQYDSVGVNI